MNWKVLFVFLFVLLVIGFAHASQTTSVKDRYTLINADGDCKILSVDSAIYSEGDVVDGWTVISESSLRTRYPSYEYCKLWQMDDCNKYKSQPPPPFVTCNEYYCTNTGGDWNNQCSCPSEKIGAYYYGNFYGCYSEGEINQLKEKCSSTGGNWDEDKKNNMCLCESQFWCKGQFFPSQGCYCEPNPDSILFIVVSVVILLIEIALIGFGLKIVGGLKPFLKPTKIKIALLLLILIVPLIGVIYYASGSGDPALLVYLMTLPLLPVLLVLVLLSPTWHSPNLLITIMVLIPFIVWAYLIACGLVSFFTEKPKKKDSEKEKK